MSTTDVEAIEQIIRARIAAFGLRSEIIEEDSQFLDFENRLFVELVIRDAARLKDFTRLMESVKSEVHFQLDFIVRANWKVISVNDPVQAYSRESGTPVAAMQYPVLLRAGSVTHRVIVDVTYLASESLKMVGRGSLSYEKELVRNYINLQLLRGGESYWDPIAYAHLQINEGAMAHLVGTEISKEG